MKKTIGLIALMTTALLLSSSLLGCLGEEKTKETEEGKFEALKEGWERYEAEDSDFRIDYPEGWGYQLMVNRTIDDSVSFVPPHQMESNLLRQSNGRKPEPLGHIVELSVEELRWSAPSLDRRKRVHSRLQGKWCCEGKH